MATGAILGFLTGYLYGSSKDDNKINRLNYSILQSLLRYQGYNKEDILRIYQLADILKDPKSYDSLIRSMPLSFLDDLNIVVQDTNLTNSNPVNRDAGLLYVSAIKLALQKKDPSEILGLLQNGAQTSEIRTLLTNISQGKLIDMTDNNILTAFYAAIAPLTQIGVLFQNWTDGVEWVTRLGGNQAVNAALAGSLLGAYFGKDSNLADKEVKVLEQVPKIYEVANQIEKEFPFFVSDQSRRLFLAYRKTLKEISKWVQEKKWNFFEADQNYFSIIFPTQENPELQNNKDFTDMMRAAFKDMMTFYGLILVMNKLNISDKEKLITYFIQGGSGKQNHLRIAQILTSLKLFQQLDLYLALKEVTNQVADAYPHIISTETKQLWNSA